MNLIQIVLLLSIGGFCGYLVGKWELESHSNTLKYKADQILDFSIREYGKAINKAKVESLKAIDGKEDKKTKLEKVERIFNEVSKTKYINKISQTLGITISRQISPKSEE